MKTNKLIFLAMLLLSIVIISCNKDDDAVVDIKTDPTENKINANIMLKLVNDQRAKGCQCDENTYMPPVEELKWNTKLEEAALMHSKDMAVNNIFSHTGSDGSSAGDRITSLNYKYTTWGENIAAGGIFPTEEKVFKGWITSPGHCKNIMTESFTEFGSALYIIETQNKNYWTQVFATPQAAK